MPRITLPLLALLLATLYFALPVSADTIAPAQVRVVEGTVSAVDVMHRAVVLDVPTSAGELTVGVTLAPDAEIYRGAHAGSLQEVSVGERASLRYTREGDRLVGLRLKLQE